MAGSRIPRLVVLTLGVGLVPGVPYPYRAVASTGGANPVDERLEARLRERGLGLAPVCPDEVFVRRVYLDVIGALPGADEVEAFLGDRDPGKRDGLIDDLLEREAHADYRALKWCDLLRVKSEFPINLWPNAVQAYHHWIWTALREGWPCDRLARELLTSSGSNFRVPAVNFYRAVPARGPEGVADAVALTFMGSRTATWPAGRRAGLAAFFSRIAYKTTAEWKEEIVQLDPAPAGPLRATFPDGREVEIAAGDDPRGVFAAWLVAPENPWFRRIIVNRIWAWLMGRGLVHEPDDLRPDNPPVHPEVIELLERELVDSGFDMRHIERLILTSRTYQQSSLPEGDHPEAVALFACYPPEPLDAEVLIDAIVGITGVGEDYWSPIPEPFTVVPDHRKSVALADGSISSTFLETFGRPARDTGLASERRNRPTEEQRRHMLHSTHIQRKIEQSTRLRDLVRACRGDRLRLVRSIFLTILSRYPTRHELMSLRSFTQTSGLRPREIGVDLVWALMNTKEFQYRH